jgi:ABC-type transport system involved in multi-copper enzyme maturation permease subunit
MRLAGGWIGKIPDYLLYANVQAINGMADLPSSFGAGMGFGNDSASPTPAHAFIILGIYSTIFLVLGFYLFRKRDVTG